MNPQQFSMGMARGMPAMNQVNAQFNPKNPMANQMARQQPMTMSQGAAQANQVQHYILTSLRGQGTFATGWQAAVPIPERMNQVKQLVDSLRLVRPPVDQAKVVEPGQQDQAQQNKQKASELTTADNQVINRRAAELAAKTSQEEMREIVSKMSPEFCNNVRSRGIEPIIYYFRMLATREFRSKKRPDAAQQPGQPAQPNGAVMQGQQNVALQNQPFTDLGRYQGQQADGLRSQEGGEVVQQAAAAQPQAPMAQPGQTPAAQPAASMQMLNRPLNHTQPGLSPQPGPRPVSRTPMPQQVSAQEVHRREQFLSQFPLAIQNILRNKPPNEWNGIVAQFRQNTMMQRSASQSSQAFGRQPSIQNGPFPASSTIGTPMQQPLNPQEMRFMDLQAVPPNTLDAMRRQQIPVPAVKNWFELKEWVMRNPAPTHPMPQQRPMPNQPQIRIPTLQDIQTIKAQNPQLQALSDEQNQQQRKTAVQQPSKLAQTPNEGVKNEPSASKPTPQQESARLPTLPKEQILQMPLEQRAQYVALRRQRNEDRARKLVEFSRQVQPKISQLRPLKFDQSTRSQMAARLTSNHVKNMMAHFDQFLSNYPDIDPNEADWKKFVEYKFELVAQYQQASVADKSWIPQDAFSVTPERLEMMLNELNIKFTQMHSTLSATKPQQQQPPSSASWTRSTGQEAQPKQSKAAVKQEDAKRRKKNPAATPTNNAATPASATQPTAPSPQALKQQQTPAPAAMMIRCPIPSCQQAILGFVSQTELNQHINTAHMTDINPATDQLAFLDATLRDVFDLDENYNPLPPLKAAPMEKTTSKSGLADRLKVESMPATPSLPARAPPSRLAAADAEPAKDGKADVLEEWKRVKIDPDQWSQTFGGWDWEEVVPSSVLKLQNDFIATYQQSAEWQSLLRPASAAETATDKSATNADQDDTFVDLFAIDGLDLSGLDEVTEEPAPTHVHHTTTMALDANGDAAMASSQSNSDDMSSSPFEMIDKPDREALGVAQFLLDHGIDYTRPDALTSEQRKLMDFVLEPFETTGVRDASDAVNDTDWEVDWEQVNKQYEQDVENRVPGTWTPDGFISEPRKRWW
ncbi:hypothetical protein DV737_g2576, partial [Chaetothyriales sp. CBS 132003]